MATASQKPSTTACRAICVVAGAIVGAVLLALAGTITDRTVWGGLSGGVIGGIVGWGMYSRVVSPAIVWICCFAVAGAFIGPGCDADALMSALAFGAVGAWIGYLRWSGVITVLGACITLNMGLAPFLLFVVASAGYFVWLFVSYLMPKTDNHRVETRYSQMHARP